MSAQSQARQAGREASQSKTFDDNPHEAGSELWHAWASAWIDGTTEDEGPDVSGVQSASGLFNPMVKPAWVDQSEEMEPMRLDDFLAMNADGLGRAEVQEIVDTLLCGKVYHGGGGAAPQWTLEVIG